jgi:hypothetical protein
VLSPSRLFERLTQVTLDILGAVADHKHGKPQFRLFDAKSAAPILRVPGFF